MGDAKEPKLLHTELVTTKNHRNQVNAFEWMITSLEKFTSSLRKFETLFKGFERAAKPMGYVNMRAVWERQRRREERRMKRLEDTLARAIWLAILHQRLRERQKETNHLKRYS